MPPPQHHYRGGYSSRQTHYRDPDLDRREDREVNEGLGRPRTGQPPAVVHQDKFSNRPRHSIPQSNGHGRGSSHSRYVPGGPRGRGPPPQAARGSNAVPLGPRSQPHPEFRGTKRTWPRDSDSTPTDHPSTRVNGLDEKNNVGHSKLPARPNAQTPPRDLPPRHQQTSGDPSGQPAKRQRVDDDDRPPILLDRMDKSGGPSRPALPSSSRPNRPKKEMPIVKKEESPDPIGMSAEPEETRKEGVDRFEVPAHCFASSGNPNFLEARMQRKHEILTQLAAQGKVGTQIKFRADGAAADWVRSEHATDQELERFAAMRADNIRRSQSTAQPERTESPDEPLGAQSATAKVHKEPEEGAPDSRDEEVDELEGDVQPEADFPQESEAGPSNDNPPATKTVKKNGKTKSRHFRCVYEDSDLLVVQLFLMQFLRLFDNNRSALMGAYDAHATFSYQVLQSSKIGGSKSIEDWPLFAPSVGRRNLQEPSRPTNGAPRTVSVGPQQIIETLQTMGPSAHPTPALSSDGDNVSGEPRFVWDISALPLAALDPDLAERKRGKKRGDWKTGLLVVCHGDMHNPQNPSQAISFDRSFVLKQNNTPGSRDFWPCLILSDQITVRSYADAPPGSDASEVSILSI